MYQLGRHRCGAKVAGGAVRLLAIGLVLTASQAGLHAQSERLASGETAALDPGAVVVLPFVNISGDPADEWIGLGIAETVTADLDPLAAVTVVGSASALDPIRREDVDAGDETGARELGRSRGASWVVAGGFQRVGSQLRITARVVSVETGSVAQTVKVDGGLDELFALQDRIVGELGMGLERLATGQPPPKPPWCHHPVLVRRA